MCKNAYRFRPAFAAGQEKLGEFGAMKVVERKDGNSFHGEWYVSFDLRPLYDMNGMAFGWTSLLGELTDVGRMVSRLGASTSYVVSYLYFE
jgi:hypothetical protein